jgi:predicted adenine nucleotide alpha hydrolase (AANH) superfamily ATPase
MKLLVHICCANCSIYPIGHLAKKGFDIKGLWFNPNIHFHDEYSKRLEALRTLEGLWELDIEYVDHYGLEDFKRAVRAHDGLRCEVCYRIRLKRTAETAKKMGLDGFTTTLLVSPYQKFDIIVDIGKQLEKEYSIPFLAMDFRGGWNEGVRLSKELSLYRQRYCGCLYSKEEREQSRHIATHKKQNYEEHCNNAIQKEKIASLNPSLVTKIS